MSEASTSSLVLFPYYQLFCIKNFFVTCKIFLFGMDAMLPAGNTLCSLRFQRCLRNRRVQALSATCQLVVCVYLCSMFASAPAESKYLQHRVSPLPQAIKSAVRPSLHCALTLAFARRSMRTHIACPFTLAAINDVHPLPSAGWSAVKFGFARARSRSCTQRKKPC